jgi:hypothetical protein
MGRPRIQEGDPRFEERRQKAKERLVRLLKEKAEHIIVIQTIDKQIAEELEVAG